MDPQQTTSSPPRVALSFLKWFCPRALYEGIEGNLLEQFELDLQTLGKEKARGKLIIGIRKVLGALMFSIVSLLSIDFIRLILIAAFLALPIPYFAMNRWLVSYSYRIPLDRVLFITPVILILFIAAITISVQVFKTARTNPAETLKYE